MPAAAGAFRKGTAMLDSPVIATGFRVAHREPEPGVCVATVEGDVDLASAPALKSALTELAEGEARRLVVDLSQVSYLDSTGLGVLVGVKRRLADGGVIVVAGAPPAVRALFELTGLDRVFRLFSSTDEAVAELSAQRAPRPGLSPDAALVLGLAATAIPFADSRAAEAERWLRMLRLYGDAGHLLTALGLGEAPLTPIAPSQSPERAEDREDAVARVAEHATRLAGERGAAAIGTGDLLAGVAAVYGEELNRVLAAHGTDSHELATRLSSRGSEPADR